MMAPKWGGMQIVRRLKSQKAGNRKAESINHARVERLAECDWRSDPWSFDCYPSPRDRIRNSVGDESPS